MPLILILIRILVQHPPGSGIDLAANHRMDALLAAFLVELDDTEHGPVVGDGQRIHPQLLRPGHDVLDPCRPIQQAVFRMYMQMCKCHVFPPTCVRSGAPLSYINAILVGKQAKKQRSHLTGDCAVNKYCWLCGS